MSLVRINDTVYRILYKDETLLRLLHYPPANLKTRQPDPLSDELDNIIVELPTPPDKPYDENDEDWKQFDEGLKLYDEMWEIIDKGVLLTSKADDLEDNRLCRVYIYSGKARSSRNRYTSKQEIVVDIFCHNSYSADQRLERITDRLNNLLFNERVNGLGRVEYRNGYDFEAPKEYRAYRHIYEVGRGNL